MWCFVLYSIVMTKDIRRPNDAEAPTETHQPNSSIWRTQRYREVSIGHVTVMSSCRHVTVMARLFFSSTVLTIWMIASTTRRCFGGDAVGKSWEDFSECLTEWPKVTKSDQKRTIWNLKYLKIKRPDSARCGASNIFWGSTLHIFAGAGETKIDELTGPVQSGGSELLGAA